MESTGGNALALGIWYQSIGAVAALVEGWKLEGSNTEGQIILQPERFDMDAVIRGPHGVKLIQFKVSGQQPLRPFGFSEFKRILQNATQAIVKHEMHEGEDSAPIVGFIVASNRPVGDCFSILQASVREAAESINFEMNSPEFLKEFAKVQAPPKLLGKATKSGNKERLGSAYRARKTEILNDKTIGRTMRDLAESIIAGSKEMRGEIEPPPTWTQACLKAITQCSFVRVHIEDSEQALYEWFQDWGLLQRERSTFVNEIVGHLARASRTSSALDPFSIMRQALNAHDALPITPRAVSSAAMEDVRNKVGGDPPTPCLIDARGFVEWILDRSNILCGLPYGYQEEPPGQIFVLVGDGGVGKSLLFAQLFYRIARGLQNWNGNGILGEGRFIGYPMILEPGKNLEAAIGGLIKTWGRRISAIDQEVDRFAIASRVTGGDSAVWVGLDGIDEMKGGRLRQLAHEIVGYVGRNPNVRFVLTSRKDQFEFMISKPSVKSAMLELPVPEFSEYEAWDAILQATDREMEPTGDTVDFSTTGERPGIDHIVSVVETDDFKSSIQQPLFVGVMRRVFQSKGARVIRDARGGDQEAWRIIATEYVRVFCERLYQRLDNPFAKPARIFATLKLLAVEVGDNPQAANRNHWRKASKAHLGGVKGHILYEQCAASGLITRGRAGSFEWRNPYVASFLRDMEEDPEWR